MRIDIHHHILPPAYLKVAREQVAGVAGAFADQVLGWTPERSLEAMDRAGVERAVTSISSPGVNFGDAVALARACNDYAMEMTARHAGRFGVFAVLPLPEVDASLREIERMTGAAGYGLYTNYAGAWLGDPKFAPVFDELNRRKAVVFVHPMVCPQCSGMLEGVPDAILEYPFDTTRTIASLLYSGTLARCRDVRFIFTHGGGALPVLSHRIVRYAAIDKRIGERTGADALEQVRRLWFDVVSVTQPAAFAALAGFVPIAQLLFGSDYPYWQPETTVKAMDGLGLADRDRSAIDAGNARRLLRLEMEKAL